MNFTTNPHIYTALTYYDGMFVFNCGLAATVDLFDAPEELWRAFNCPVSFSLN